MATHDSDDYVSTASNELEVGQTAPLEPDSVTAHFAPDEPYPNGP
jgi:hypothetical protein